MQLSTLFIIFVERSAYFYIKCYDFSSLYDCMYVTIVCARALYCSVLMCLYWTYKLRLNDEDKQYEKRNRVNIVYITYVLFGLLTRNDGWSILCLFLLLVMRWDTRNNKIGRCPELTSSLCVSTYAIPAKFSVAFVAFCNDVWPDFFLTIPQRIKMKTTKYFYVNKNIGIFKLKCSGLMIDFEIVMNL